MSSFRLILVRHGETSWNHERQVQDWQGIPLSAEGRAQAQKVARALAASGAAAVYASPLGRARETAEIIAKPHRLPVTADEAFTDVSFGEGLATACARAVAGIERLRGAHGGATVVLVSHGVIVRLLVLDALGLPPERLWAVHATPAGISEIEYRPGWTTVHRMNTLQHLESPLEP